MIQSNHITNLNSQFRSSQQLHHAPSPAHVKQSHRHVSQYRGNSTEWDENPQSWYALKEGLLSKMISVKSSFNENPSKLSVHVMITLWIFNSRNWELASHYKERDYKACQLMLGLWGSGNFGFIDCKRHGLPPQDLFTVFVWGVSTRTS